MEARLTVRSLPTSKSLRFVLSQVARLRNALFLGITGARERVLRVFPTLENLDIEALRSVIADEYGFDDWSALEAAIVLDGKNDQRSAEKRIADAVFSGDITTLAELIRTYPQVIRCLPNPSALGVFAQLASDPDQVTECLTYLLRLGFDLCEVEDWDLGSTLRYSPRLAAVYLRSGAAVKLSGRVSNVAYHEMAAIGFIDGLRLLTEVSPEGIAALDEDGYDPVSLAAENGHIRTVSWLLQNGASVSDALWNVVQRTGYTEIYHIIDGLAPKVVRRELALPGWTSGTIRWVDRQVGCILSRDGVDVFFDGHTRRQQPDGVFSYEQGTDVGFVLAPSIVPYASRLRMVGCAPLQ